MRLAYLPTSEAGLRYTVARDTVWIIDVRDQRGLRSADALRQSPRELRARRGRDVG